MSDLFTRSTQAGSKPVGGQKDEQVLNLLAAEAIRLAHLATNLHLAATAQSDDAHASDATSQDPGP